MRNARGLSNLFRVPLGLSNSTTALALKNALVHVCGMKHLTLVILLALAPLGWAKQITLTCLGGTTAGASARDFMDPVRTFSANSDKVFVITLSASPTVLVEEVDRDQATGTSRPSNKYQCHDSVEILQRNCSAAFQSGSMPIYFSNGWDGSTIVVDCASLRFIKSNTGMLTNSGQVLSTFGICAKGNPSSSAK